MLFSIASREPIPRYFFSRTPSEKKYSPGASVVAASNEPIITGVGDRRELFMFLYYPLSNLLTAVINSFVVVKIFLR